MSHSRTASGGDAMTSVVQTWTRTGSTPIPEFRFGADGGNFSTARGYASLAGARGLQDQITGTGNSRQDDTCGVGIACRHAHDERLAAAI